MTYTIFDLETTGLVSGKNEVIQFSYLRLGEKMNYISSGNLFFYHEGMDWSEEAYAVHGISQDFLKQYKDEFEQNLLKMYSILQLGCVVGHNVERFDLPFADRFLNMFGLPHLTPVKVVDTMKLCTPLFHRKPKLIELPEALGYSDSLIQTMTKVYFGKEGATAHDARYDVTSTSLALREIVKRGYVDV